MPNQGFPFASSISDASLTGVDTSLYVASTQAIPTPLINSIAASVLSSFAANTVTSVSTSSLSQPTQPLTTLATAAPAPTSVPTSAPTSTAVSTPTLAPAGTDSKKSLSIGLGVCLPIVFLCAVAFIAFWLNTRRIESKKKDDLEKTIEWLTPPPSTPGGSSTLLNMTGMDGAGAEARKVERTKATNPISPLSMKPLNEEELAIARKYGLPVDTHKGAQTSGRSPKRPLQRRSGGMNLTRQWFDGSNDSPPRSSTSAPDDPFSDANAVGLAVSTNDLYRFQPTRLSTITDKSEEIELPEMVAGGTGGAEALREGTHARGRFLERFMMKRKGLVPLDG